MLTRTILMVWFLIGGSLAVWGQESLSVLPEEVYGLPKSQMLDHYLKQKIGSAIEQRSVAYEKLKTEQDVLAYQQKMRNFFREQIGPFPEKCPLNPQLVGKLQGDSFKVEKIIFESQPNFFVTALLYLPDSPGPHPAVIIPCGHTANGKTGYQKPSMLLAKNGIAAFCYDPIGQGERYQILDESGKNRFRSTDEHTLTGANCIPVGLNAATYRIWDGMRSIDYLQTRKDIIADKIGCTGNSGGGTLTEYLVALEDRIICAAPGCAVTSYQRRIATNKIGDAEQNIFGQIGFGMDHADYLIMAAPRPILICAATQDFVDIQGTWDVFREVKRIYTRTGDSEKIELIEADHKHGFSQALREAMTEWMCRWLKGELKEISEPELKTFSAEDLQCSPHGQVLLMPNARSVGDLNQEINARYRKQRKALWQNDDSAALAKVREITGIRKLNELSEPKSKKIGELKRETYKIEKWVLEPEAGISLAGLLFVPDSPQGEQILYLHEFGKETAIAEGEIEKLVGAGATVLAIDLRGNGETGITKPSIWGGRWNDIFLSYLLGRPLVTMWTEDLLVSARFLSNQSEGKGNSKPIKLIAKGRMVVAALHAVALENQLFSDIAIDKDYLTWSELLKQMDLRGQLASTMHGALRVYDLTDLLNSFRSPTKD